MSWKLNVGDIHNLKPIQNKNYVLAVLRSKTKNILSPDVKSMADFIYKGWIQAPSISEA